MQTPRELFDRLNGFVQEQWSRITDLAHDLYSRRQDISFDQFRTAGRNAFDSLREKSAAVLAAARERGRDLPTRIRVPGMAPAPSPQPSPPPIAESPQFIEWMLRHDQQLESLRALVEVDRLDLLVANLSRALLKELQTHRGHEALAARLAETERAFLDLESAVHAKGGLRHCPKEVQGNFLLVRARLLILPYFQKYLYKDSEFFDKMGLRDL
jgi:hypothetical protein